MELNCATFLVPKSWNGNDRVEDEHCSEATMEETVVVGAEAEVPARRRACLLQRGEVVNNRITSKDLVVEEKIAEDIFDPRLIVFGHRSQRKSKVSFVGHKRYQ
jgi:hypothetical protein